MFSIYHKVRDGFVMVAMVDCDDKQKAFYLTNHIDSDWTKNPQVRWVEDGDHRSTSVGDLLVDCTHFMHRAGWIVEPIGFSPYSTPQVMPERNDTPPLTPFQVAMSSLDDSVADDRICDAVKKGRVTLLELKQWFITNPTYQYRFTQAYGMTDLHMEVRSYYMSCPNCNDTFYNMDDRNSDDLGDVYCSSACLQQAGIFLEYDSWDYTDPLYD